MSEAVVIDAVRTPIARAHPHKGWFKDIRSDELGVIVVSELLRRTRLDPGEIEDVILGCANQTGEQAMDVARYVALMAGLPFGVAAQTINRQCASGMTAVHSAAQAIMTGQGAAFIAGGIESMTHLPEGAGADLNPRRFEFVDRTSVSMGLTAENLAEMYGITRQEQEEFALRSHQKAVAAQHEGRLAGEIVPVEVPADNGTTVVVDVDQNPRDYTTLDLMASLEPIARAGGSITAATATTASDGASAILLMSGERAAETGLKPMAKVVSMAVTGVDPKLMGLGVVAAATKALERAGLTIADVDVAELNEAFAVVAMAAIRELGIDEERVNPNGGTVALGHPMGCTGAILVTSLAHEMVRRRARYGLASMCVGMGQGAATILELAS
jgi:acetyl-CoA acetyltransferase family protein